MQVLPITIYINAGLGILDYPALVTSIVAAFAAVASALAAIASANVARQERDDLTLERNRRTQSSVRSLVGIYEELSLSYLIFDNLERDGHLSIVATNHAKMIAERLPTMRLMIADIESATILHSKFENIRAAINKFRLFVSNIDSANSSGICPSDLIPSQKHILRGMRSEIVEFYIDPIVEI